MPRCAWCHQSIGELHLLTLQSGREQHTVSVHPDHEGLVVDWHRFIRTRQAEFVLRLSVLPLLLIAVIGLGSFINRRLILPAVGLPVVWLAITLWQFPVATPQTVSLVGIRRSITLCRALAVLTGLIGALLACAGSWLAAHVA